MPSTAHPDAFHFASPVKSYWEETAPPLGLPLVPLTGHQTCDVAIIGGGYTGISCALELAERSAGRVVVLEAAEPGWGASGRNGGFVCIGAAKLPWPVMTARYGLADTRAFYRLQCDAVAALREMAQRYGFDADMSADGEIALAHKPSRLAEFRKEAQFLAETFGARCEILSGEDLRTRGLHSPAFHGGIFNPVGYSTHPLKLARGLARAAHAAGAIIHPHSPLRSWRASPGGHLLTTDRGLLEAKQVVFACNGFTQEQVVPLLKGRIMPVLSNILVTRPLSPEERAAQGWTSTTMCFDSRILLHYFRLLPDGRFLFGGRGGTDASRLGVAPMEQSLRRSFERMFPAWAEVQHTHFWQGLACLAYDLVPYLGPLDKARTVWTALAYHGNGVAMANWSGRMVGKLITGAERLEALPKVITRRLARYPAPNLRPAYLKAAYAWYGIRDEWL
ncbi:NAD(P)/FAD-dependent oxidoreductase [Rhodoligotrophos ferricapiens]|uniref:NAD(P)/FAD-dependent oxidoreductase n=1 Tax=Rhodoligotrophos ferricapiens TaxID=3069264 RepID=UPI00315C8063